jgi:hypothetical protein
MSATDAYYSGDVPGMTGFDYYGGGGRGVLGSLIPSNGDHGPSYLFACLNLPADADTEVYGVPHPPGGLTTFAADENGAVTAAASDGTYRVPFDLYSGGALVGSSYFDLAFGVVVQTVTEVSANSTQSNNSSTGAATVTPATSAPKTVTETAATSMQTNASSTGAAGVIPAGAFIVDATKIPASRRVVFPAPIKVVRF